MLDLKSYVLVLNLNQAKNFRPRLWLVQLVHVQHKFPEVFQDFQKLYFDVRDGQIEIEAGHREWVFELTRQLLFVFLNLCRTIFGQKDTQWSGGFPSAVSLGATDKCRQCLTAGRI